MKVYFLFEPVGEKTLFNGRNYPMGIHEEEGVPSVICFAIDKGLKTTEKFYQWAEKTLQEWLDTTPEINNDTFRQISLQVQKEARLLCKNMSRRYN